mmetsp:Transcript_17693/g.15507  ORF Transcript_17693/g.15507 Transcript_17693/m.15507 type:complete len:93 (-) Transcript_17693:162-440(-)
MAGKRQVDNAKIALQHNIGLGGACVVGLYKKYNDKKGYNRDDQTSDPDVLEKFEKQGQVSAKNVSESPNKKSKFVIADENVIPSIKQIQPKL